jgi:ElaB/YqjD/DUF883 family membrane-anchored ribosome-binding protein
MIAPAFEDQRQHDALESVADVARAQAAEQDRRVSFVGRHPLAWMAFAVGAGITLGWLVKRKSQWVS